MELLWLSQTQMSQTRTGCELVFGLPFVDPPDYTNGSCLVDQQQRDVVREHCVAERQSEYATETMILASQRPQDTQHRFSCHEQYTWVLTSIPVEAEAQRRCGKSNGRMNADVFS